MRPSGLQSILLLLCIAGAAFAHHEDERPPHCGGGPQQAAGPSAPEAPAPGQRAPSEPGAPALDELIDGPVVFGGPGSVYAFVDREYVWSPHDFNELILQTDSQGNPYYVHQDANLNVTAITTAAGAIRKQYVYSPYGEVLDEDNWGNDVGNRVGFQGMFFERWSYNPMIDQSPVATGALGGYITLNRVYDPRLGRWLQRDPNATGQPVLQLSENRGNHSLEHDLEPSRFYADGPSLFALAASNPITRRDPAGLSWENEDAGPSVLLVSRDWDDIYESVAGNGSAYLGVQGAATWGTVWGGNVAVLPDGAAGFRGISEGVSDFADEYADQVTYLPVEGVFAGMGLLGGYVATGANSSRYATIALRRFGGHHAFPWWAGGNWKQWLVTNFKLPWNLHRVLESRIRAAMLEAFDRRIGGIIGSRASWRAYFLANPGHQRRMLDVLIRVYRDFDRQHGTPLMEALRRTLRDGLFTFW